MFLLSRKWVNNRLWLLIGQRTRTPDSGSPATEELQSKTSRIAQMIFPFRCGIRH